MGSTGQRFWSLSLSTVHPHGRGEYVIFTPAGHGDGGSPPRAWGIPPEYAPSTPPRRFTPTGVGNTIPPRTKRDAPTVHPHGRGEYSPTTPSPHPARGSPPRAWGIRLPAPRPGGGRRFTPTGVGNTSAAPAHPHPESVHPHGRGEYFGQDPGEGVDAGSPPRAWGIQPGPQRRRRPARFTPTGVGNTHREKPHSAPSPVHPHGRGEYPAYALRDCRGRGSPPRAWGIRRFRRCALPPGRFTPTGVGNT